MDLPQLLVAEDVMKKNLVQKKESSLSEMKTRHGIQRTRDQKCGNYITLRSKKEEAFVYSQSLTGQRQISGNISNAKKLISFHYILQKNAQLIESDGNIIMVDDDRLKLRPGEKIEYKSVRFRTLGCYPLTGGVESKASTLDEIIDETLSAVSSERTTRVIDNEAAGSMERRKREGYF